MTRLNKFHRFMKASTMLGALMLPALTGTAMAQDKGVGNIAPISGWTVKPMASNTDNAYCALSRSYNQNLVLTIGQSVSEEYSLAIDFLDASLDVNKAYDITFQPGPGQIRAYEMMPASARAMVIRIGFDDSLMETLASSGALKAEIEGKPYNFTLSDFGKAQADLKSCMGDLEGASSIQTAQNDFSAQKIENAPPIARPAPKVEKVEPKEIDEVKEKTPAPQKAIAISKTPEVQEKPKVEPELELIQKSETPRPPIVMERVSRVAEVADTSKEVPVATAKAVETPIKISRVSSQVVEKPIAETEKIDQQRAQADALIKTQAKAAESAKIKAEKQVAQKAQEQAQEKAEALERQAKDIARQQAEKAEQLKQAQAQKQLEEKRRKEAEQLKQVQAEKEQAENLEIARLASEKEKKISTVQESTISQEDVVETEARLKKLEEENRALYMEARQARAEIDKAVVNTGNQALAKMREYEKKLNAAREDNLALSKEVEEMRRMQEDGLLGNVAGDWDLEKSTQRYNEAEREIKRLGLLLEQQRVSHRREKAELEQMLFDPAVTEREQRRKLTELELKLEAAERQLTASGARITDGGGMPAVPAPRVASSALDKTSERVGLSPLSTPSSDLYSRNNDSVLASIRAEQVEIARLNAQIKEGQKVRPPMREEMPPIPRVEDAPTSISAVPAPVPVLTQTKQPSSQARRVAERVEMAAPPNASLKPPEPRRPIVSKASDRPGSSAPYKLMASANNTPISDVMSKDDLRDKLTRAGININGTIDEVGQGQYQWSSGQLKGQAQIVSITNVGGLDQFVANFMNLSEQACKGDFASLPAPDVAQGRAFEVACITPQSNMSSSLIFKQIGSQVVVIGHEISADDMDVAMDARDRIAEKL